MKRILNVNNYHYRRGGSDVVYLEHASLMKQQGFENSFFSMNHPKNEPSKWSKYFVDEIEFGHAYSLKQKLSMSTKVIYSFEAQRKLKKLIQDFPADVAHLHCIYHHLSPSIIPVLKEAKIPVVLTAHDLKIACPAYKMLNDHGICEKCKDGSVFNVIKNKCIRNSYAASAIVAAESSLQRFLNIYKKNIDRVIAPSHFYFEKLKEWGWPESKLVHIPNYVDADKFSPSFSAGEYFLYFGRLAPEKGVATLIKSAVKANVKLKIAGTGPLESELKELVNELGGSIEFLGFKSGKDLELLIQEARAIVLPSEWYENAPMSILESYAYGKPVIGANIGGIPEMIIQGKSGWVFESKNIDELTACLLTANKLDDKSIMKMGEFGRDYVKNTFSRERYIESILSLYQQLGVKA